MKRKYKTKSDVLKRAQEIIGIPMKEIDKTGRLETGKGALGTVIEESWFEYKPNTKAGPDFAEAHVELKVTPYIQTSKGVRAKERLVCNIINYMTECNKDFKTSDFWYKCENLLIMSYEYKKDVPKQEYFINKAVLFSFPEEDLVIIEQDWNKIVSKIRDGKAHLLTEGDTLYLAACTKGANSKSMRKQPFNNQLAKQRAYSLKSSYMTRILNQYIFGNDEDEHIIKDWHLLENITFEDYILDKLKDYYGMTQIELKNRFNIDSNAKSLNSILLAKMLGVNGKVTETKEFKNANIIPKTIRIQHNGTIRESMSFPTFTFLDVLEKVKKDKLLLEDSIKGNLKDCSFEEEKEENTWENSALRRYIEPAKFLFVIFKENQNKEYVFERIKFWNIPYSDLEEVEKVWNKTVKVVTDGVKFVEDGKCTHNNLPKQSENRVSHVRPHAQNKQDTFILPDGKEIPKQSFWFNRNYLEEIIE